MKLVEAKEVRLTASANHRLDFQDILYAFSLRYSQPSRRAEKTRWFHDLAVKRQRAADKIILDYSLLFAVRNFFRNCCPTDYQRPLLDFSKMVASKSMKNAGP